MKLKKCYKGALAFVIVCFYSATCLGMEEKLRLRCDATCFANSLLADKLRVNVQEIDLASRHSRYVSILCGNDQPCFIAHGCESIEMLNITCCPGTRFVSLSNCKNLQSLTIVHSAGLKTVLISGCTCLNKLMIADTGTGLESLYILDSSLSPSLREDIDRIRHANPKLHVIYPYQGTACKTTPSVEEENEAKKLEKQKLDKQVVSCDERPLNVQTRTGDLSILCEGCIPHRVVRGCNHIETLNIICCPTTRDVTLYDCEHLKTVRLENCANLERLFFDGCTCLDKLTVNGTDLKSVYILHSTISDSFLFESINRLRQSNRKMCVVYSKQGLDAATRIPSLEDEEKSKGEKETSSQAEFDGIEDGKLLSAKR